ncbi:MULTISPECIES: TolC family protein [Rhizobium]|uniref:Outer membrane protein TolC n=1 Tax=Rhizobium binae TaxID=1138190 RepID=A0ABV2MRH0_9HYPH|nr:MULTISPECIES: TolC family protein [Rhizobium]NKL52160.1 hypothetical protein [Rhizobium leguminosarum bv. viciae]MBX4938076.1 TolC family protein [Rhizobium binae]MBX4945213.1 TolC family protein [Rhizobium binae]MBX4980419.1 TolC family protein [Rhizobium binae]MBX4995576.1 TolC family protein [Rhizobium binae]
MHSFRLAAAVLPLLLSSCMLGPDHAPPETPLPEKFSEGAKQSAGDVAVSAWWDSFSDRTLDQYVASGLDENLSVQQALEKINAAAADVTIAGAGGLPKASHTTSGEIGKGGDVTSTQNVSSVQLLNFRVSAHHIAALLALPSETVIKQLQKSEGQPVYRGKINAGIPADLICNRFDIRQAERDLAAATAQIGVTEAQLYPAITLSGSITPSYIKQRGRHGGILKWSFGPSLDLPILDGGRLQANVETSKSDAAAAYISWKLTVLTAVQEVEDALTAVRRDVHTENSRRRQVETIEEALKLSMASYTDGASSLLDVLEAQRQMSSAQASLAAAIQQLAKDHVRLNVAIRGGFAAPKVASPREASTVAAANANIQSAHSQ